MDKLVKRALQARAQAARRLARKKELTRRIKMNETRTEHTRYKNLILKDMKQSRKEEKEDHFFGPMRPRRAVGKEEIEQHGALDQSRIIPPPLPPQFVIKNWNIVEKDRVLILAGPDRHKIGIVQTIDKQNNTVLVEKMNMVPMLVPEIYRNLDPNQPAVIYREQPIHYNDVRLVFPLPDPVTGELKDTVIANIAMSKVWHDKAEKKRLWTRYVAGTTTEIPWPEKEEKVYFDQPSDTRIMDVETKTFVPALLQPPFPESVVDELRNKYSKFRTRHDPEYIAKIQAKEAEAKALAGLKIRTPLQELNKAEREKRKAKGKPVITEEVLEKIGLAMVQNKPELLEKIKSLTV